MRVDIKRGFRRSCSYCPIALALSRTHVGLEVGSVFVWSGANKPLVEMPKEAQDWITRFDAGWPIEPFSFDLPDEKLEAHLVAR